MKHYLSRIFLMIIIAVQITACSTSGLLEGESIEIKSQQTAGLESDTSVQSEQASTPSISPSGSTGPDSTSGSYVVVDTGQDHCYSDTAGIGCPLEDENFYGQDAQYQGVQAVYRDNGDGTVTDLNTGLMWQQEPDLGNKSTYAEAFSGAESFSLSGYDDWRLPTIKELYSLIDFNGSSRLEIPYLNTNYFSFRFGDEGLGERQIDAQYWSSTEYVGTTMNGNFTVFGVNFADGRIKGYPAEGKNGREMEQFVRYVRGNLDYGQNIFINNDNGTIADQATGLVWQAVDSGTVFNWDESLNYCENLKYGGFSDWRLPNAKELQSIVDYSRSPQTSGSAAINPLFSVSETESWYWTSTTHLDHDAGNAVYLAFGQAYGLPDGQLIDVHGAGAQRSDPKSGNPEDYREGRGSQGQEDQVRILNYARCVRGGAAQEIIIDGEIDTTSDHAGIDPESLSGEKMSGGTPPLEAINACSALYEGSLCSFSPPTGPISGTCRSVVPDTLACVPESGPPQ
jgi:hypothetical protein